MAIYFGNKRIGEIKIGTLNASSSPIALSTPSITLNSKTGVITATVTQPSSGYLTAGSSSATLDLQVQGGATITPSTSEQIAVSSGKYTLGTVKVAPVGTETINITNNGTYTPSAGKFYSSVSVNVPVGITINNENISITATETQQTITATNGYTGIGTVTVNAIPTTYIGSGVARRAASDLSASGATVSVPAGYYATMVSKAVANGTAGTPSASKGTVSNNTISITPSVTNTTGYITGGVKTGTAISVSASELVSGNKAITANGTNIDVTNYKTVSVNVPTSGGTTINNQNKTVSPTEAQQTVSADSGYTGLGTVTVNAISSTYIGSNIPQNSSSDLIVSGGTVTAPAGYYVADASASVATMSLPTSAASSKVGTTKATIGRSTSAQYINIPVGYNAATASYTISAVPNGSVTTPASISGTGATVQSTGSNYINVSGTVSVTPNVTTAGYISAGTSGNSSVSLRVNVTTKAAATITPGTTNQTIAAGTYLVGAQTISGDANLVAGNIKSGVSIFGVAGTYSGSAGLDTSDATAVAANILNGKTAYVNGSKIIGTMDNNGALSGTINVQNGTYTIPAGYTSGGTVTASITASTLTNSIINGQAYEEETGDYAWRTTVNIPAGYHNAQTLTKNFSSIFPAPDTPATASQVLLGYQAYDKDGKLITGTMANNSYSNTLTDTRTSITIPAGYHDGTGTVSHTTVDIPDPTISINSSGVITASGSWTKGYTIDSSYSKTYNMTTKAATTYRASASAQTIASGTYLTGTQTIAAVSQTNLSAANIKAGTTISVSNGQSNIWSVTGTFTSDATATAADINIGETAYINGSKVTGTQTFATIHTGSSAPSSSVGANGDVYLVLV